jgi:hypothetical protein
MADPVTGLIVGGANIAGGLLGAKGAKKAAKTEAAAAQAGIDLQRETRDMSLANLRPFLEAGQGGLQGLQQLATTQLDPNQFYNDYFQGQEYAQLSDQARRNVLAGSEATGGLRTTSTANMLGSIAPQLAQSAFARQQALQDANYNRQMGLVNVGLNAAGGSNAAAGNAANATSGLMQQQGAALAGGRAAPYQAVGGALTSSANLYLGHKLGLF